MAIRLEHAIVRGELTNETRGRVAGRIWLAGRKDPLELDLRGNCLRDLAGCRLTFENPEPPVTAPLPELATVQHGTTGDMTASRKIRVPLSRSQATSPDGEPPATRLVNSLYLEWFSEENGRIVIESSRFKLSATVPMWTMSAAEERAQLRESQENFHDYLDAITGYSDLEDDEDEYADDDEVEDEDEDFDTEGPESPRHGLDEEEEADIEATLTDEEEEPLDEFQWEQELREADRRAEAYQEAFDRYKDHPNRERLIAEAMGWEPEEVEEFCDDWQDVAGALQPADPGEVIETAGSFTDDSENRHHPLSRRAMIFALRLQRDAEMRGLLGPETGRESPVFSVIVSIIALGGKLAAALDGTMHGMDPEPGFVIAMLKRAQIPLNEALHSIYSIPFSGLDRDVRLWLSAASHELFDLRKDILDLMRELRMQ